VMAVARDTGYRCLETSTRERIYSILPRSETGFYGSCTRNVPGWRTCSIVSLSAQRNPRRART